MPPRKPDNHNHLREALELQATLYSSRNPTRKWLHQSRRKWIAEAVTRYFPDSGGIAADAGTGCGALLERLGKTFSFVIGLDSEPSMLCQARRLTMEKDRLNFIAGDLGRFPLKNDRVDLILCSEVIEHVTGERACLEEIHRVLRPGGILILTTPQPFSTLEIAARIAFSKPLIKLTRAVYREPVLPPGHINLMSTGRLSKILSETGFAVMETHKSGLYLPFLAEIPREWTVTTARKLNDRLSGTMLDFLLWTQFFVAVKRAPTVRHNR